MISYWASANPGANSSAAGASSRAHLQATADWPYLAGYFARVLSDRNRALLGIIAESGPESLARLAELTGRKKSNLSRTLKTMERYGFVQLSRGARGSIIPRVPYQKISLTLPLSKPGLQGTEAA